MPSLLLHTRVCAVATLHNVNAFILVKSQNIFNILRFTEIVPFNLHSHRHNVKVGYLQCTVTLSCLFDFGPSYQLNTSVKNYSKLVSHCNES